ncbi:Anti-sigma-K factor rskA [Klenkia marina]|uniref:Regulator of SigK n=1 Tax=Klenkia marina TaxID=1960309 RepID=A0A1G4YB22_9ACTN|nr:anti-sigma factor [Klenkia marina]SCX50624.1 Anti-sigma-K factor rskA [Klenkia marina]
MSPRQRPSRDHERDHEEYDELAVGWALHVLEPEDEAGFAGHLAGCERCARIVADTHEVMASMADDLPAAEPSEGLRERLRAAVEETEQVVEPTRAPEVAAREVTGHELGNDEVTGRRVTAAEVGDVVAFRPAGTTGRRAARRRAGTSGWRRVAPRAVLAAGVAAVLGLGVWNVTLVRDRDAAQATAASQSSMMSALLSPGRITVAPMEHDGRTVATVVARDGQAQVLVDGMTPNDVADSTYVLWGVTADGPVALGTFDVVADGTDLRTVGSDATGLDEFSAYGISIEPGRNAPSTPTDIVANGQVTS